MTPVLEPDSTRVVPTHAGAPTGLGSPHALQILTTEHWSLLSSRSLGYTESMSRASMYLAALSGSVIALALVGQATDFGDGFVAFALVLLPVVYFLGLSTFARLGQNVSEDGIWVQGINRIRHAYLELAPELEPYFVASRYDDEAGIFQSSLGMPGPLPKLQPFFSVIGVVVVVDSVVAGSILGIAALGGGLGTVASLGLGALGFALSLAVFVVWAERWITRAMANLVVRFPTPETDSE